MWSVLSNGDAAVRQHQGVRRRAVDGDNFGRKKLENLNADVLFLIFDELDLGDMLKLLKDYPDKMLSAVANEYFWRKYKDYTVQINCTSESNEIQLNDEKKCIFVENKAALFLRLFGGVIRNLKVLDPSTLVTQYINKYTSDSLIKLQMRFWVGALQILIQNPLEHFKKPFSELVDFAIFTKGKIKSGILPFNQLFPKLRQLELVPLAPNVDIDEMSMFPHLESVRLDVAFM